VQATIPPPRQATSVRERTNAPANLAAENSARVREPLGPGQFPGLRRPFRSLLWAVHTGFGTGCLVLLLAILAAIPVLNILTLGYLVEAQRKVAVSGRLRDGFPLLHLAPRLGVICFFTLLFLAPVRMLAFQTGAAMVIRQGTEVSANGMLTALRILQFLVAAHLLMAIARGGTVGCFLRPVKNIRWLIASISSGNYATQIDVWAGHLGQTIRPMYHFWLGLKAALGAVLWLAIPTALLVAYSAPGRLTPMYVVLSFAGGILMIPVAAWLPQLQTHQAVTGRFMAIFEVRTARSIIAKVPIRWMLTTLAMFVMTLPLHLSKIKLPPADAFLIVTPFFILLTYPARIFVAWAYHQGMLEKPRAWFGLRWGVKLLMFPALAAYAFFLFLTPAVSELGKAAPLENHAFLSPAPPTR
jgi:hypothetical protein